MDVRDLQRRLHALGCYAGAIDGSFGPASKAGLKAALTGPRDRLAPEQIAAVAASLDLTPAHVGAVVPRATFGPCRLAAQRHSSAPASRAASSEPSGARHRGRPLRTA